MGQFIACLGKNNLAYSSSASYRCRMYWFEAHAAPVRHHTSSRFTDKRDIIVTHWGLGGGVAIGN